MIIYKDIVTEEELFTDAFKVTYEGPDDFLIAVHGKMITRPKGGDISADLIGGNPSQEEEEEGASEVEMESGVDIALYSKLTDHSALFESKKTFQSYVKKWLKNTAEALKDQEEKCTCFKKACQANMKLFFEKHSSDASFFAPGGDEFDPVEAKHTVLIGVWAEDGMSITLYGIREGMIDEKC